MKKQLLRKKQKKYMTAYAAVFLILLVILAAVNLLTPDRKLSTREKRTLAEFPTVSPDRILDGSFSTDFEEYASDQVFGRDFFITVKSGFSLLLGQKESQGVYYCAEHYLMERMDPVNEDTLLETLQVISSFSENAGIPSTLVLVPNAVSICSDLLPGYAITEDQASWIAWISGHLSDSIELCDLTPPLTELYASGEQVYYRTDHHWTTQAAYFCLPTVANALGLSIHTSYSPLLVEDAFTGSLAAKSGFVPGETDSLSIYAPEEETAYLVTNISAQTKTATVYSTEGLNSTDPYTVFLGGNADYLSISTENIGKEKLLVLKDSYFNCFLPFLLSEYEEIDIVDPRYYYGDIQMLLYEKNYDRILYFYNLNTFAEDTSLTLTLGGST